MPATLLVRLTAEFTIRSILRESRICDTHNTIYLIILIHFSDLSERLNLSQDEGEKWIVNLIRETRMGADAKIDLEKVCRSRNAIKYSLQQDPQNVIEINRPPLPVYQSVIEKTRGLAFRTQAIGAAMEKQPAPPAEAAPVIVEGAR